MYNRFRWGSGLVTLLLFLFTAGIQAGELEKRFAATLARAETGDAGAMYSVGEMYELGMGTDSDRAKSMNWYRAAADKGHPEGAYQIGYAYYWGKAGLDKDRRQAHVWFLRAAEAGSHAAMPYLAKMYRLGQGVTRDNDLAELWSARAAADSSSLYKPPPEPEVTHNPPPPPVVKAEPPAEPAPEVEPQPAAETASRVAAKPAAQPAPQVKRPSKTELRNRQMQRLLDSWWQKDGRPALYLPSGQTSCSLDEEAVHCQSRPRRSSLLGRPYLYRFRSNMKAFDGVGRFTLRYWPDVTKILPVPPGSYGTGDDAPEPPSDEDIRMKVERPPEEMACEMFKDTHMECADSEGNKLLFQRMDKQARSDSPEVPTQVLATVPRALPQPAPQADVTEERSGEKLADKASASEDTASERSTEIRRGALGR